MRIYGASDDLVEIEGHTKGDEVGCYNSRVAIKIGGPGGGMIVVMRYAERGSCWSAEVSPWDEDVPMPWPVRVSLEPERKYSALVEIDCPADVPLSWDVEDGDEDKVHRKNAALREALSAADKRIVALEADVKAKATALAEIAKASSR